MNDFKLFFVFFAFYITRVRAKALAKSSHLTPALRPGLMATISDGL